MSEGTLSIQSENILPIIKKWLYTDKDIFLRELVSNACDAIHKVDVLASQGQTVSPSSQEGHSIDITIDAKKKTLSIADSGIGMTAEEVEKYIAQLAFSGAEEFVKKYQEGSDSSEGIIGHFGLGFYSAFMASSQVEIDTLSFLPDATPAFWSCDGSSTYLLDKGTRTHRGTTITLSIAEESEEFLDETQVRAILTKHCRFLPIPITLNGKRINDQDALWTHPAADCSDDQYRTFYRALYPLDPDPIFWIHLNVDYPFRLKGILYFPKLGRSFDPASQNKSVHLYCNRVFVSDNCKDLLPDHLMVLRGVIDSPDLPLNVSRSNLQMDRTIRQLGSHISKKIADKLISLHSSSFEEFTRFWPNIELIVKLGILQDEKFYDKVRTCLLWKSSTTEWTTLEDYLTRNQEKAKNKIFYHHDASKDSHLIEMYKKQGIEVLFTSSHLDTPLMSFLEGKQPELQFQRLDGAIDTAILDAGREKTLLDAAGKTEAGKMADSLRALLAEQTTDIEPKSLASDHVHAFLMLDEKNRRLRDYFELSGQQTETAFAGKKTLVINTNSPLIQAIHALKERKPDLAKEMALHLYHLTLLDQKELSPDKLTLFLKDAGKMLTYLSQYAHEKLSTT